MLQLYQQELFEAEMTNVVKSYNDAQKIKQKEYLAKITDKTAEDALEEFPLITDGS